MLCSISLVHAKSSGCVDLFTGNVFWGRQGPLDASLCSNVVLVPPPSRGVSDSESKKVRTECRGVCFAGQA